VLVGCNIVFCSSKKNNIIGMYEGVTLYVCGYASFSVFKLSNCANCHSIVKDFKVENSGDIYFASLQRGDLCLSSDFLIQCVRKVRNKFDKIVSINF
jgi:hypothetical protein